MFLRSNKIFLLGIIFLTTVRVHTERIKATSAYTYIRNYEVAKKGYTTTKNGDFIVVKENMSLPNSYDASSTIEINDVVQTNVLISITKNNTFLDLNNKAITANKIGYIAIGIADGVSGVTIKNGTFEDFESAIIIGKNTTDLTFENLTIRGCSHTDGAIRFKGTAEHFHNLVCFNNIRIYKSTARAFTCSNIRNLHLNNITCCSNIVPTSTSLISIHSCNNIRMQNITANNDQRTGGTTGLEFTNCRDIVLQESLFSNNSDSLDGSYTIGIKINNSDHMLIVNTDINNLTQAKSGIEITDSKNIDLEDVTISNCSSGSNHSFIGVLLSNAKSINIRDCNIETNTGATELDGIKCTDATCENIAIHNTCIKLNSCTNGNLHGINASNSNLIYINNCYVINNKSSASLYGLKANNTVEGLHCKNTQFNGNS